MLERLPSRTKITQLMKSPPSPASKQPIDWASFYFSAYDRVRKFDRRTNPASIHIKRLAHLIHRKLCNALLFLDENSAIRFADKTYTRYTQAYLNKGFSSYEAFLQSEMLYPDRFAVASKKIPDYASDEVPLIHACLVIHSCFVTMFVLADTLAGQQGKIWSFIYRVSTGVAQAYASTLMFRVPLIREIAQRDTRGKGRRKGAHAQSWIETIRDLDRSVRKLLRLAIKLGHTDRYEFHQSADKKSLKLNKWVLALDIAKKQVEKERREKKKPATASRPSKRPSSAERRAEREAVMREAEKQRGSINKDLLELYGNDLTINDVLSHPFEWHLIRKKPTTKPVNRRKESLPEQ